MAWILLLLLIKQATQSIDKNQSIERRKSYVKEDENEKRRGGFYTH
jgi:hypothetical protein